MADYKTLGTWSADISISAASYAAMLDAFEHSGVIHQRYAYADVVVAPPA